LDLTAAGETHPTEDSLLRTPNVANVAYAEFSACHPPRDDTIATSMGGAVKSILLVLAGFALALGIAAPASAKAPCSQAVINDWFDNGRVDQRFPRHCYTEAINNLPTDVETYSSAKEDIQRALLALIRGSGGNGGGDDGGGAKQIQPTPSKGNPIEPPPATPSASEPPRTEKPSKGVIWRSIEWLGPSDAASVPVPLLVLAGVAFLLLAAAGGTLVSRRLQERRLPPPPQA
jgi:hypothetical protein